MRLCIGTYADAEQIGIYRVTLADGKLTVQEDGIGGLPNPSYLAMAEDGGVLYAALETGDFEGKRTGGVAVIDAKSGEIVQTLSSEGRGPCHISVAGKWAFAANYGSGHTAIYARREGGTLECRHVIEHAGTGLDPRRQEGPHAHFAQVSPNGKALIVCDLGLDAMMVYPFDNGHVGQAQRVSFTAGGGPRHVAFSADGRMAYVVLEMSSQIGVVDCADAYRVVQIADMLPVPNERNTGGAVRISEDGHFVYATNRGDDSIAAFAVQPDGTLGARTLSPCGGRTPRDILPIGGSIVCCNQDSDTVTLLAIGQCGRMEIVDTARIPKPVCALRVE